LGGRNKFITLLNAAEAKVHGLWFSLPLGSPKMGPTFATKGLQSAITALCHLDIPTGRAGDLHIGGRCRQDSPKWGARKDLAVTAVTYDDSCGIYERFKRDLAAITLA
jgi:hypothetical protein